MTGACPLPSSAARITLRRQSDINKDKRVVNESLIRSAQLSNLFHVDGTGRGTVQCLYKEELPKLNSPHPNRPAPVGDLAVSKL